MKKTKLNNKKIWLDNYIRKITDKNERNNNIWVYGSWLGDKYADNSRYFFEYMNEYHKEIESIWISNNESVVKEVREKGYNAYLSTDEIGKEKMKQAGVTLFTNSIMDLGDEDLCSKSYKVALWHGMPFKKIYSADNRNNKGNKIKLILKEIKRKMYSDIERNLSISTSELIKEYTKQTFLVNDEDIIVSGQPRNDILIKCKSLKISDVIKISNIKEIEESNPKIICYMPTYRSYEENAIKLDKMINDIVYSKELEGLLIENNSYLVIKGHYLLEKNNTLNERILFINDKDVSCTQELLSISDALVTDYSSVFIDYLITQKPVIFLVPDYEEYEKYENGMFEKYEYVLSHGYAKNTEEFIKELNSMYINEEEFENKSIVLNSILNTAKPTNESFSENVYIEISKRLK